MAQKQWLVEVWADFEQTIVNKVIDQWSKQAFVKTKGQLFEHSHWTFELTFEHLLCVDSWNVLNNFNYL